MRKFLIALLAVVSLLGITAPAISAPARPACGGNIQTSEEEILNVYGLDGRTATWEVSYGKSAVEPQGCTHSGQIRVDVDSGFYTTDPGFLANAIWLDVEWTPGQYAAVAHYGGTASTVDDVSTQVNMPSKGTFWLDADDSPAWRFSAWGVEAGSGNHFERTWGAV